MKKSALLLLIKGDIDRIQIIYDEQKEHTAAPGNPYISGLGTKLMVLKIIYEQIKALDSLE